MTESGNNVIRFAATPACKTNKPTKHTLLCLTDSASAHENLVKKCCGIFELTMATTIFNALQALKSEIPSMIVVQLHLKDENCFDFLRMLKSNPTFAKIPIVTCCVDDVFDKNIEDYLVKATKAMGSELYIPCSEFYSLSLAPKLVSVNDLSLVPVAS